MPPFLPNVPRCQHLKVNGTQCGCPALKRNRFCFFHKRFQDQRVIIGAARRRGRARFDLPVLEDANAIQVSLMQIMRLLASGQMDPKIAGLMLYALQTASFNLRHTRFEPLDVKDVVIDRNTIDQTCIGGGQWCEEDFEEELTEEEAAAQAKTEAAEEARAGAEKEARLRAAAEKEANRLIREGPLPESPFPGGPPKVRPARHIPADPPETVERRPPSKANSGKANVNLEEVRKRVRGAARDWLMSATKSASTQTQEVKT